MLIFHTANNELNALLSSHEDDKQQQNTTQQDFISAIPTINLILQFSSLKLFNTLYKSPAVPATIINICFLSGGFLPHLSSVRAITARFYAAT